MSFSCFSIVSHGSTRRFDDIVKSSITINTTHTERIKKTLKRLLTAIVLAGALGSTCSTVFAATRSESITTQVTQQTGVSYQQVTLPFRAACDGNARGNATGHELHVVFPSGGEFLYFQGSGIADNHVTFTVVEIYISTPDGTPSGWIRSTVTISPTNPMPHQTTIYRFDSHLNPAFSQSCV
jgi:hypothetical protein